MGDVSVTEAADLVAAGSAVLLDVRESNEWVAGHAPVAVHLPMSQLAERQSELPEGPILAVCRGGVRSANVAATLAQAGYDVVSVLGGMNAWAEAGLPVVDAAGQPGVID